MESELLLVAVAERFWKDGASVKRWDYCKYLKHFFPEKEIPLKREKINEVNKERSFFNVITSTPFSVCGCLQNKTVMSCGIVSEKKCLYNHMQIFFFPRDVKT